MRLAIFRSFNIHLRFLSQFRGISWIFTINVGHCGYLRFLCFFNDSLNKDFVVFCDFPRFVPELRGLPADFHKFQGFSRLLTFSADFNDL